MMLNRPPISGRRVPTWVLWAVLIITVILLAGYTILAPYTGFKGQNFGIGWSWWE
jgi:hypothetical protein